MNSKTYASLLIACTLTGCLAKLPSGTGGATSREGTIKSTIRGTTVKPPSGSAAGAGLVANNGAGIVSNNGGGIISNNSGSLVGVVKAPAGIISNASGGYRVLATAQVPVAGVRVQLRNAAGEAVLDKDGKAMTAVTDSQGQYAFSGFVPTRNLVLQVDLSAEKGRLQAIVSKSSTDKQVVDVDLVSTLVTGYILDQYVKGQADQQQTLDKLPANVEAETRAKATTALDAGVAVPATLTPSAIVQTVNAMRVKDTTFDQQMETVKRLLIAAGQSDLGNGRLATEVALGYLEGMLCAPDGTLYLAAAGDRRVWRLSASGRIETYAGSGTADGSSLNGKKAVDANYASPSQLSLDAQGRLIIVEAGYDDYPARRLTRIEADGTVSELEYNSGADLALQGAGDELWLLKGRLGNQKAELHAMGADKVQRLVHTFTSDETPAIRHPLAAGRDAQGRLYIGAEIAVQGAVVYRFDPASKTMTRLYAKVADNLKGLSVDAAGNIFLVDAAGALKVQKPDGATVTLLNQLPAGFTVDLDQPSNVSQVALAPDGTAYLTQKRSLVYHLKNGQLTRVAGVDTTTGDNAQNLALQSPSGVALMPGGGMVVGDAGLHQLVRIKADNTVSRLAGTGQKGFGGDGAAATAATLDMPMSVRADGVGNVYFIDNDGYETYRIRKIATGGTISTLKTSPDIISDLAVSADGTVYYRTYRSVGMFDDRAVVERLESNGTATTLLPESLGLYRPGPLALGPDGALYALDSEKLYKWTAAQGAQLVKEDERLSDEAPGGLAIDAQGRIYLADSDANTVSRWNPATDEVTLIAGPDSANFAGTAADDSLSSPGYLALDAAGNLFISDTGHKQVKRLPADRLR